MALGPLRAALADPRTALLLAVWAASRASSWAFALIVGLHAHEVGGAAAVGLAVVVRMVAAALAAPLAATLADRVPQARALLVSTLGRLLMHGATGVVLLLEGPFALVLALAAASKMLGTIHRPAHLALLPTLVRTPGQLAATNVATSAGDYLGFFLGSLLAGTVAQVAGLPVAVRCGWVHTRRDD